MSKLSGVTRIVTLAASLGLMLWYAKDTLGRLRHRRKPTREERAAWRKALADRMAPQEADAAVARLRSLREGPDWRFFLGMCLLAVPQIVLGRRDDGVVKVLWGVNLVLVLAGIVIRGWARVRLRHVSAALAAIESGYPVGSVAGQSVE